MRIVYYLTTYKNERLIRRLVNRLQSSPNSFVLIHHDAKSGPLTIPPAGNLHVLADPLRVRWGSSALVMAMWKGVKWLQDADLPFDWMITLTGQDYPIKPLAQIEAEMGQTAYDAFMHHELISEDPALRLRAFHTNCLNRYFYGRLRIPGLKRIRYKRKHPYVNGFNCYAGEAILNLSRPVVENLWAREAEVNDLMHYLSKAPCPDETLFQTILVNDNGLSIANSSKRFIVWKEPGNNPQILGPEHFDDILASDAWFARKVDDEVYPELLDQLDEVVLA